MSFQQSGVVRLGTDEKGGRVATECAAGVSTLHKVLQRGEKNRSWRFERLPRRSESTSFPGSFISRRKSLGTRLVRSDEGHTSASVLAVSQYLELIHQWFSYHADAVNL